MEYRENCSCRKPQPGLLEQAAAELNISLADSYLVGDRWSDLKCAERAGCTPVLVLTGYGRGDLQYTGPGQEVQPQYIAETLVDAVNWIINDLTGKHLK